MSQILNETCSIYGHTIVHALIVHNIIMQLSSSHAIDRIIMLKNVCIKIIINSLSSSVFNLTCLPLHGIESSTLSHVLNSSARGVIECYKHD